MTWIPLRRDLVSELLDAKEVVNEQGQFVTRRKNQTVYQFGQGFVGVSDAEHLRLLEFGCDDYKLAFTDGLGYRIFISQPRVATMVKLQWG